MNINWEIADPKNGEVKKSLVDTRIRTRVQNKKCGVTSIPRRSFDQASKLTQLKQLRTCCPGVASIDYGTSSRVAQRRPHHTTKDSCFILVYIAVFPLRNANPEMIMLADFDLLFCSFQGIRLLLMILCLYYFHAIYIAEEPKGVPKTCLLPSLYWNHENLLQIASQSTSNSPPHD